MRAISNSSVLIALSSIGLLSVLVERFPQGILIPKAVWHEVVESGGGRTAAFEVSQGLGVWLSVREVENILLRSVLQEELDDGEAEAIVLFCEYPTEAILLDEKKARQVAGRLSLPVLGTLSILIWAKQEGLISNLKEQLDNLRTVGKFRLSKLVCEEALKRVGEL